jgi:hypothetical protein
MADFLYIYRGGVRAQSPAEGEKQMQRWMAWMEDLGKKGVIKDRGQPLDDGGKVVRKDKSVTDGPYAETKDVIGGYTLVTAKDLSQAAEFSKGCPIFESGGLVEVRPIMEM